MTNLHDDPHSDSDLVIAANRGDRAAFEAIYRRHRAWVANLAMRFTHDQELAMDVTQETFIYLMGRFPGFELTSQLRTYLYPVVRNIALTHHRREARPLPTFKLQDADTSTTSSRDDDLGALSKAMESLPIGQREVVLLRFMDGLSLREIAEALQVPSGTIKSRLHNALATLRSDDGLKNYFLE